MRTLLIGFRKAAESMYSPVKDGLEVYVLLFGLSIVTILGHNNKITIVPAHDIHIALKAVRGSEADMITTETEGSKAIGTAEDSLTSFIGSGI